MATRKKTPAATWPQVTKGTHLTVTTYEDGRTELVWDDKQLLEEVRQAIASVTDTTKPKRKSRKNDVSV